MTSTARHERIVVVGGGATGTFAALGLRQAGHTGPLTLVAAERRVAYERPPLSKEVLLHPGSQAPLIGGQAALRAAGVLVRAGVPVVSIDRAARRVVLQGGESIDYDRVLLATGCRARPLSVPGGELALSLRDHDDADRLSARLVAGADVIVIGGGFVGLEVAAAAVARGARVRVLEAAPRLLGRSVPPALATEVAGVHAAHGVEVRCGVRIERLRAEPGPAGGILGRPGGLTRRGRARHRDPAGRCRGGRGRGAAPHRTGGRRRTDRGRRHRGRRVPPDRRPRHLGRRRLLRLPAGLRGRPAGARGVVAQRSGSGHLPGDRHAHRSPRDPLRRRALVLVGPVRPDAAGGRSARPLRCRRDAGSSRRRPAALRPGR
ncbi:MAG: FAD-dependent oxidoreductase [Kineosporiaceae bacterium]|nr:FAD-dependent oxidoreductase [Kineosporiaceae bacterium]